MRKTTATILLLSLLLQCLSFWGIKGLYELRREYIAGTLCENPRTSCQGKCFLRKQLKKSEDNSNTGEKSGSAKQETMPALAPELQPFALLFEPWVPRPFHPVQQDMHDCACSRSVFHPPGLAAVS